MAVIQSNNLMGVIIKSLNIFCNHKFKLYNFVKFLFYFFIATNQIVLFSQTNENNFNKVIIEVDGDPVLSVYKITQDHQGYIWMSTNLGLIRYDGIEGKKYDINSASNVSNNPFYVDSQGDIWIGNRTGIRLKHKLLIHYSK